MSPPATCELCVVGAGAAGLFAAIHAVEALEGLPARVILLDSAARLGAKILVAGGGRCNVTHHAVDERDFCGSTPASIRRVLRSFPVERTVEWFRGAGVELKREETGKLFPVSDSAQTVLDALLGRVKSLGAELVHPARVESVEPLPVDAGGGFRVRTSAGVTDARRVILATGGKSLPKSGSDGHGFAIAHALGHTTTPRLVPALVALVIEEGHWVRGLAGVATRATLTLSKDGQRLVQMEGDLLLTHFGVSGPVAMNISRHWTLAGGPDPLVQLEANFVGCDESALDERLLAAGGQSVAETLSAWMPARLARALCEQAGATPGATARQLSRQARLALARLATHTPLPVTGDRGWNAAEATAGGVPLSEVELHTMESRRTPGLHLAGEILDVDGRIGGFNFQWAWASGHLAGRAAGSALKSAKGIRRSSSSPSG